MEENKEDKKEISNGEIVTLNQITHGIFNLELVINSPIIQPSIRQSLFNIIRLLRTIQTRSTEFIANNQPKNDTMFI